MDYYVYMLRCEDGSLYTGITTDPERRFEEHARGGGKAAKYTRAHKAVRLEAVWAAPGKPEALRLERMIKKLPKSRKEELARGKAPEELGLGEFERVKQP